MDGQEYVQKRKTGISQAYRPKQKTTYTLVTNPSSSWTQQKETQVKTGLWGPVTKVACSSLAVWPVLFL